MCWILQVMKWCSLKAVTAHWNVCLLIFLCNSFYSLGYLFESFFFLLMWNIRNENNMKVLDIEKTFILESHIYSINSLFLLTSLLHQAAPILHLGFTCLGWDCVNCLAVCFHNTCNSASIALSAPSWKISMTFIFLVLNNSHCSLGEAY